MSVTKTTSLAPNPWQHDKELVTFCSVEKNTIRRRYHQCTASEEADLTDGRLVEVFKLSICLLDANSQREAFFNHKYASCMSATSRSSSLCELLHVENVSPRKSRLLSDWWCYFRFCFSRDMPKENT